MRGSGVVHPEHLALGAVIEGAHGARRVHQRGFGNIVGIRKGGFFAAHGTHAYALVDAEGTGFDNALLQTPAFGTGVLKVQISFINLVRFDFGQCFGQVGFVQTKRL